MRLLLVEDDDMLANATVIALKHAGLVCDWVSKGQQALHALAVEGFDLVLLDIGLPDISGLEVLVKVRQQQLNVPVIILTAQDALSDRIGGLNAGADDYLVKPFEVGELIARIHAVYRRQHGIALSMLSNGDIVLNTQTYEVTRGETSSILTQKEFMLLEILLTSAGQIFSRQLLEERIYGWDIQLESNAIEFLIHAIRKKLGQDCIKNIRGAGWFVIRK